jgi:hypothetical protein
MKMKKGFKMVANEAIQMKRKMENEKIIDPNKNDINANIYNVSINNQSDLHFKKYQYLEIGNIVKDFHFDNFESIDDLRGLIVKNTVMKNIKPLIYPRKKRIMSSKY